MFAWRSCSVYYTPCEGPALHRGKSSRLDALQCFSQVLCWGLLARSGLFAGPTETAPGPLLHFFLCGLSRKPFNKGWQALNGSGAL
ncbi:hypothetical protein PSEUDO9AG_30154 [Pseudomonas sp. 9Ag]|nr:hypothetical protein PSEUDO9AG_30154 [Pseudomonas sp. 9Ag]